MGNGMKWTKEKPTKEGFYWYRSLSGHQVGTIEVVTSKIGLLAKFLGSGNDRVETLNAYFHGPIEPPPFDEEAA